MRPLALTHRVAAVAVDIVCELEIPRPRADVAAYVNAVFGTRALTR